jgi:hypothetical protein
VTGPDKKWLVEQTDHDHVHVMPEEGSDHIEHQLAPDCVCGPRLELVERDHGPDGWISVHASLDGRERNEAPS